MTGRLSFVEVHHDGVAGVDGLASAAAVAPDGTDGLTFTTDVAVSHDGGYVYASGFLDDALAVFERAGDGSLSFLEVERDGVAGADGLNGVTALAVSGDDRHVYATGNVDHAAAVFHRDLSAPLDPATVTSTSHVVGVFSPLTTIDVEWSGAADGVNGLGVAGYWVRLSSRRCRAASGFPAPCHVRARPRAARSSW